MCRYRENPMDDHAQVGQFQGNLYLLLPRFSMTQKIDPRPYQLDDRFLKSSETLEIS